MHIILNHKKSACKFICLLISAFQRVLPIFSVSFCMFRQFDLLMSILFISLTFRISDKQMHVTYGPRQANLLLIAYASSEGSGEPAHPRSLARTSAARSYKQWVKRNLQTESQIHSPSEWLGMRSWNLSWRNARRHKFAWRGPYSCKSVHCSYAKSFACTV